MANNAQRYVEQYLPGGSNRLDYSNRELQAIMPTSLEEWDELMHDAYDPNTGGPGSSDYADLMLLYQAGYDRSDFAEAAGGGIPRSMTDTQRGITRQALREHKQFDLANVDPLLLQLKDANGTSFAALGPEKANELISLTMIDADPSYRQQLVEASKAIANSPLKNDWGMEVEPTDEPLIIEANSGDGNGPVDPTGYAQWRQATFGGERQHDGTIASLQMGSSQTGLNYID